jgi:streptogramin lyase
VAFQVLTARLPFERDTPVATMWAHTNDPPPDLKDYKPELAAADEALKRGLAKSPDVRYQSAGDFVRALDAALSGSAPPPERSVAVGDAAPEGTTATRALSAPTTPFAGPDTPTAARTPATTAPDPGRRRPRWLVPFVIGLLLITASAVALFLVAGDGGEDDGSGDALSARTLSVTPIRVGGTPQGIAVGEGGVWFADNAAGTVRKLDAESGEPQGDPIRVGESPKSVVTGEGYVWVVSTGDNQLTRVDPDAGEVSGQPIDVGYSVGEVNTGDGAVWVADTGEDKVLRIDPKSNRVVAEIDVPSGVGGNIAVGDGLVWVAGKSFEPALTLIETKTNRVVPGQADFDGDIAAGEGFGWSFNSEPFVARIDPKTKEERGRATFEGSGGEVEVGAGAVWALDESNGRLWRIDPKTARVRGSSTPVQAESDSTLAIGPDAAWVTQPSADTVVRIGF